MPCYGGYWYGKLEANPKLWAKCQKDVSAKMLLEGWKIYAGKFSISNCTLSVGLDGNLQRSERYEIK